MPTNPILNPIEFTLADAAAADGIARQYQQDWKR